MKKFFFLLVLLTPLFLLSPLSAGAVFETVEEEVICPGAPLCLGESWTEYQCSGTCPKSGSQTRTCGYDARAVSEGIDKDGCEIWSGCEYGETMCSGWQDLSECESWQQCQDDGNPGTIPACLCQGDCLGTPQNPRYYDNPTYSDRLDKDRGDENLYLPVKLDWDDVEGWGQPEGPQSYAMRITTTTGTFSDVSAKSEYIPRACLLPSNKTTNWGVKACCSVDGQNCGPESNWNLSTNLAPELISPYDPDWAGEQGGENIAPPVTLNWCSVEEATAYQFRTYLLEDEEEICHPWMELAGTCEPVVLKKTLRPPPYPSGLILYSDFPDEKKGYFTKDTEYIWEMATCIGEYATECSDFGQKWKFKTSATALPITYLSSPPNDPNEQNPVGLPLILDWNDKPGVNSYRYEVTGDKKIDGGTQFSQAPPLDFGVGARDLSLNTPYSWRVWTCWDYEAKKCEENPLDEWHFKTTGAPPKFNDPSPETKDVIIPVKFDWQDVGGAKSYILKISGDGLNKEIVVDGKSEFSLDFPEYNIRQEKTYAWQVKTCAWEKGKGACGEYGSPQTFTTFRLPAPPEPSPIDGGQLSTDTKFISWGTIESAKAYQYQIKYLSLAENETDESCPALIGQNLFKNPKTIPSNSDFIELKCLGQYQWQARACLDKDCQETGEWSNWSFFLVEPGEISQRGGLVPCGQSYNNPNTPWNERDPCQIKHIFLLIKIIVDFVFTRLIPFALILLTLGTGVMFYFSLGGKTIPIIRIKKMWKWAIIGLFIAFFAWTLVNLVLKLVGFNIGVFGNWYQI